MESSVRAPGRCHILRPAEVRALSGDSRMLGFCPGTGATAEMRRQLRLMLRAIIRQVLLSLLLRLLPAPHSDTAETLQLRTTELHGLVVQMRRVALKDRLLLLWKMCLLLLEVMMEPGSANAEAG